MDDVQPYLDIDRSFSVPRRVLLAGLSAVGLAGVARTFASAPMTVYDRPDIEQLPPAKTLRRKPAKPLRYNVPMQIGVDMSDPAKAGTEGTVFLARYGARQLTNHVEIEGKWLIPASMQKSYTALLIIDMLDLQNIYGQLANNGEPNMRPAAAPLIALDDMVEITPTAAALNTTKYKQPGRHYTLQSLLTAALKHSDNGAVEALAVHCGRALIKAGYIEKSGPGAEHRAFNAWGERQARGRYGLSAQFRMLNAHGLPGYETLVDLETFKEWSDTQNRQPWSATVTSSSNKVPHFGKRNVMDDLKGFEALPAGSGICTTPVLDNRWGLLDGCRIMAQWQMRHADKLQTMFDDESGKLSGQLKQTFRMLVGKTGTSWAAGECLHVVGLGSAKLYGLAAGGKLGTRTRYARVAEVLNMYQPQAQVQPTAVAATQPTRRGLAQRLFQAAATPA